MNMSSGTGLSECFLPSSQDQLGHLSVPAGTKLFEHTFAVCLSSSKVERHGHEIEGVEAPSAG